MIPATAISRYINGHERPVYRKAPPLREVDRILVQRRSA